MLNKNPDWRQALISELLPIETELLKGLLAVPQSTVALDLDPKGFSGVILAPVQLAAL